MDINKDEQVVARNLNKKARILGHTSSARSYLWPSPPNSIRLKRAIRMRFLKSPTEPERMTIQADDLDGATLEPADPSVMHPDLDNRSSPSQVESPALTKLSEDHQMEINEPFREQHLSSSFLARNRVGFADLCADKNRSLRTQVRLITSPYLPRNEPILERSFVFQAVPDTMSGVSPASTQVLDSLPLNTFTVNKQGSHSSFLPNPMFKRTNLEKQCADLRLQLREAKGQRKHLELQADEKKVEFDIAKRSLANARKHVSQAKMELEEAIRDGRGIKAAQRTLEDEEDTLSCYHKSLKPIQDNSIYFDALVCEAVKAESQIREELNRKELELVE